MYPINARFRDLISAGNRQISWHGKITLTDESEIAFDKTSIKEDTGSFTFKCTDGTKIDIGNVYAAILSLHLKNMTVSRYALYNAVISDLYSRVTFPGTDTTWGDVQGNTWGEIKTSTWGNLAQQPAHVDIPVGEYIIKEVMQVTDGIKITAYDYMILLDAELPSDLNRSAKYPYDWLAAACTACGVTLGVTRADTFAMPNGQRKVGLSNSDKELTTWRDLVAEIAAVLCANAMMDRWGRLVVRTYTTAQADSNWRSQRYSSDFSDYQSYYTGIYLTYKEDNIQEYQSNTTPSLDTGLTIDLESNAFMQIANADNRHAATKAIIDGLAGKEYTPFKVTMPFNPLYDLMDVIRFYGGQAGDKDVAPITSMIIRIGGKMDISCGGEDPTLKDAKSKETKAISAIDSGGGYGEAMWMVMNNAPSAAMTIQANTKTLIGQAYFYAKDDLSMMQIAYTATYVLSQAALVWVDVEVDSTTVYHTEENQLNGQNRLTVTTGYELSGKGSHRVEIFLTVTTTTINDYDSEDF